MTADLSAAPSAPVLPDSQRLLSLDALRGFDMWWILGLEELVKGFLGHWKMPGGDVVVAQLGHEPWEGFHFYDLIFPLFLFIAGVSMAIALPKRQARHGTARTAWHLVFRAAVLFSLGLLYNGGLQKGFDQVRWLGVLQRIALASLGAGLLSLWLSPRKLLAVLVLLLAGYWALLTFVPVPGIGAGHFAEGQNLTNYLDRMYLPGRKYDGDHDPEGYLSTLPAIGTALLGLFAGKWITGAASPWRKILGLVLGGALLVAVGWWWHGQFPVVKKLWTSSFVLVAGGWSAILLGLFYAIVDVAKLQLWTRPFVWVGANPILLYVCSGLGFFGVLARRITGQSRGDDWLPDLVAFVCMLAVARFLYRRGVFVRA